MSPEEEDHGAHDPAEDERHDDMLVMRVSGVEQVLKREEVDVIQRDEEGGAPAPEEDEDRQDRVCPRRSRLRRLGETRGPSTFRAELGALSHPEQRLPAAGTRTSRRRIARCV